MCGICGVYNYKNNDPADRRVIEKMTASLVHRGPDDCGFYFGGPINLGMRRLSIIDIAGGGQPITNENGRIQLVFNGEIYNFKELRQELRALGHVFKSRTDGEVVVHAYEQWGQAALNRLNGMFGLGLWDENRRLLLLARDPYGVKPLYYYADDRRLVFGSEIRAILASPGMRREVDWQALDQYLTFMFVPSPRTAFAGIKKLPPGHCLLCRSDGVKVNRFHALRPELRDFDEAELAPMVKRSIEKAVTGQMAADVPVGVTLSGGLDSSAIAVIAAREAGRPIDTFTVGFKEQFADDEIGRAREISRFIGSRHHEVLIGQEDYLRFLPFAVRCLEEPIAATSTLAFYKVCELASRHVKVVLTGQGADEPFAGYPRYLGELYGGFYRKLPGVIRDLMVGPLIRRLPRNEQIKRAVGSLGLDEPVDRLTAIYTIFDSALKNRLYREGLPVAAGSREVVSGWLADAADLDGLGRMTYIDSRISLADNLLLYGDKMAMAVSLEARVPFLDLDLMALAESIPARFKIRRLTQKYILKKALAGVVPPHVAEQRKIGFSIPIDNWLKNRFGSVLEEVLLDPGSACRQFFKPAAIRGMLDDHRRGRHDYKRPLFALFVFELWHQEFIGSRRAA